MVYDLPSSADVSAYLMRFGCAGLYVLSAADQTGPPVIVGCAVDLKRAIGNATRIYASLSGGAELRWAGWCEAAHAKRITQAVVSTHRANGMIPLDVPAAIATIEAIAQRYGVRLNDHRQTMQRAAASVSHLAGRVEIERQAGGLRFLASEYRRRRIAAQSRGEKFMTWNAAQAKLRRVLYDHAKTEAEMARLMAEGHRIVGNITPDILRAVFE